MKPHEKWLFISMSLIILTILVHHTYQDKIQPLEGFGNVNPPPPPPPKIDMDYLPEQEPFGMYRTADDPVHCTFVPDDPRCSHTTSAAASYQEGFVEGLQGLDPNRPKTKGEDFNVFLDVLLQMLWFIVYVLVMLPEHILVFIEGLIWLWLAWLDVIIGSILQLALDFYDLGVFFADITKCGMDKNENIATCMLWYVLEFIIYLGVMLFAWLPIVLIRIFSFGQVDINPIYLFFFGVKGFRDVDGGVIRKDGFLANISHMCYSWTGYEFMHFPDNILHMCYACDFVGDLMNLIYDVTIGTLRIFEYPVRDIANAAPLFWHASYIDALLGSSEIPPLGGGLENYKPPPVPPRLANLGGESTNGDEVHGGYANDMSSLTKAPPTNPPEGAGYVAHCVDNAGSDCLQCEPGYHLIGQVPHRKCSVGAAASNQG
jgi:hypothetical protein